MLHAPECPLCGSQTRHFHTDRLRDYFHCQQCELVLADPQSFLSEKEELARYDLHENDPADAGYRAFLNQLAEPLLQRIAPGSQGLDFGCGPGPALAQMLTEEGMSMQVYDPFYAPDRSVLARQYDFVTCTEVVEHFYQPLQNWQELAGLVRPGGWLGVMTALHIDSIDFARWHYPTEPTHVMFYAPKTVYFLAEKLYMRLDHLQTPVFLLQKPPAGD